MVRLQAEEREQVEQLVRVGEAAAYRIRHAQVLLALYQSPVRPARLTSPMGSRPRRWACRCGRSNP